MNFGTWAVVTVIVTMIAYMWGKDVGVREVEQINFAKSKAYADVEWEIKHLVKQIKEE